MVASQRGAGEKSESGDSESLHASFYVAL
jgi:hypothetical protein